MRKSNVICIFVCLAIGLVSFWLGSRYDQIKRHRQELILYANKLGDEILRVNENIDLIKSNPIDRVRSDYNNQVLSDIGCSAWIKYLDEFDQGKLETFYHGVELAIEKAGVSKDTSDPCIKIILDKKR